MFSEDPILLPEIVDQIVLVTVHPASEREDEELQRRRHSLRLLGRLDQHRPSLGRFFAPYGMHARARSMARRIRILARPSGSRSRDNVNPEARNRANTSRNSVASFSTRRRSCRISCWSSGSFRGVTLRLTIRTDSRKSRPRSQGHVGQSAEPSISRKEQRIPRSTRLK